jgi:hypothetical protein
MKVKYGHEFCGTSTQEWLLWKGPEAIVQVNYRAILSSERVPHYNKTAIVREINEIWSWDPDAIPALRQTGRLIVGHKLTSASTDTKYRLSDILTRKLTNEIQTSSSAP